MPKPELNQTDLPMYPTHITGNQNIRDMPTFTGDIIPATSDFALVTCGGLGMLDLIDRLIPTHNYNNSPIPKVFLLDSSCLVKTFWEIMKWFVTQCSSKNEFFDLIDQQKNNKVINDTMNFICQHIDNKTWETQIKSVFVGLFDGLNDEERINSKFIFFKKIIMDLDFISHDWCKKAPFEYIKQGAANKSIYVYPTNVVEYMIFSEATKEKQKSIIENIMFLNPKLTIHSRTQHLEFLRQYALNPKKFVLVKTDASATDTATAHLAHLAQLDNREFSPLDISLPEPQDLDNYMLTSYNARKIQRLFRGHAVRKEHDVRRNHLPKNTI